jgi:hypothetical protein
MPITVNVLDADAEPYLIEFAEIKQYTITETYYRAGYGLGEATTIAIRYYNEKIREYNELRVPKSYKPIRLKWTYML